MLCRLLAPASLVTLRERLLTLVVLRLYHLLVLHALVNIGSCTVLLRAKRVLSLD